jgi:hypothetical protein
LRRDPPLLRPGPHMMKFWRWLSVLFKPVFEKTNKQAIEKRF